MYNSLKNKHVTGSAFHDVNFCNFCIIETKHTFKEFEMVRNKHQDSIDEKWGYSDRSFQSQESLTSKVS